MSPEEFSAFSGFSKAGDLLMVAPTLLELEKNESSAARVPRGMAAEGSHDGVAGRRPERGRLLLELQGRRAPGLSCMRTWANSIRRSSRPSRSFSCPAASGRPGPRGGRGEPLGSAAAASARRS
eukprot:117847-Pyramimonas_sp.AAC.1